MSYPCQKCNQYRCNCITIAQNIAAEAQRSFTPNGNDVGLEFKMGVFWYEKELYDLLQRKGWGDVCSATIASEMAEIVAKKTDR